jgi:hypothetical protein
MAKKKGKKKAKVKTRKVRCPRGSGFRAKALAACKGGSFKGDMTG